MCNTSINKIPLLEDILITAYAKDGICSTTTDPSPATISRLIILATVRDPGHRLFQVSQLAKGKHPDSVTLMEGPKATSIKSPGMELGFHSGDFADGILRTSISLSSWDPFVLFAELLQAGLVGTDGGRQTLTLDLLYEYLRHKVCGLVGFKGLVSEPTFGFGLSSHAKVLLSEVGDVIADPRRTNAALERIFKFGETLIGYPVGVEDEFRTHVIRHMGPKLDEVLPFDLSGLNRSSEPRCGGFPCHDETSAKSDSWEFIASHPVNTQQSIPQQWGV